MSVSSIDHGVSLRLTNQPTFKSGQKSNHAIRNENFHLVNTKSQRNFVGARRSTIVSGAGSSACNTTQQSINQSKNIENVASKVGLRINSHRQEIINSSSNVTSVNTSQQQICQNSQSQTIQHGPHSTKNYTCPTQSFKSKLQSKYGISAQNKMFSNGKLPPNTSTSGLPSATDLSIKKANTLVQTIMSASKRKQDDSISLPQGSNQKSTIVHPSYTKNYVPPA